MGIASWSWCTGRKLAGCRRWGLAATKQQCVATLLATRLPFLSHLSIPFSFFDSSRLRTPPYRPSIIRPRPLSSAVASSLLRSRSILSPPLVLASTLFSTLYTLPFFPLPPRRPAAFPSPIHPPHPPVPSPSLFSHQCNCLLSPNTSLSVYTPPHTTFPRSSRLSLFSASSLLRSSLP